jgi:hypothetical protein
MHLTHIHTHARTHACHVVHNMSDIHTNKYVAGGAQVPRLRMACKVIDIASVCLASMPTALLFPVIQVHEPEHATSSLCSWEHAHKLRLNPFVCFVPLRVCLGTVFLQYYFLRVLLHRPVVPGVCGDLEP